MSGENRVGFACASDPSSCVKNPREDLVISAGCGIANVAARLFSCAASQRPGGAEHRNLSFGGGARVTERFRSCYVTLGMPRKTIFQLNTGRFRESDRGEVARAGR